MLWPFNADLDGAPEIGGESIRCGSVSSNPTGAGLARCAAVQHSI
jgi:hypothetical protein